MLSRRLKKAIKGRLKNLYVSWRRRCYSFSPADLTSELGHVGVRCDDTLFVHSSLDRFDGFIGNATDANRALQAAVAHGTLVMPTLPFRGSAVDYVSQPRVFDVKKTPSQMGLLTELFRRQPGVLRSIHPTHSVAACGVRAVDLIADHHLANTPCGRQTPYGRLLDCGGKILFLGTDVSVMTFFHYLEEELEPHMPFSPFTQQVFSLFSRDLDGNQLLTRTRLFNPYYSQKRNLEKLVPLLKSHGAWQEARIGALNIILFSVEAVSGVCREMAQQGVYCYDT